MTSGFSKPSPALRRHLAKYWTLSQRFYDERDFALSAFFSITLLEEVGKSIMLQWKEPDLHQAFHELMQYLLGPHDEQGKDILLKHHMKYMYAADVALSHNPRVLAYSEPEKQQLRHWFTRLNEETQQNQLIGERIFALRNRVLYFTKKTVDVSLPENSISKQEAFLLMCVAGEAYAETPPSATGMGLDDKEQIWSQIDARRRHGP